MSRKLMLMLALSVVALYRGAGLMERMMGATPGEALVKPGAGEALLRNGGLQDILAQRGGERSGATLRNGFSMGGEKRNGAPAHTPNATPKPSTGPMDALVDLLNPGGDGAAPSEEEEAPPPKPTSIVRVRNNR